MSKVFRLMYDTVKLRAPCTHTPFGARLFKQKGSVRRLWYEPVHMKGAYGGTHLSVRSVHNGKALVIEGSFAKFFQGHNAWGTAKLFELVHAVLEKIVEELNLSPLPAEREAWKRGDIRLQRVDVARSFKLRDLERVRRTCREVASCLFERPHKHFEVWGGVTVYSRNPRRKGWTFYAKGPELRKRTVKKRPLPADLPLRAKVLRYADRLLRAELSLRSTELQDRKLSWLRDWIGFDVAGLWEKNFLALKLRGSIKKHLSEDILKELKPNQRAAYQLHSDGNGLEPYFSAPTLRKIRKILLKRGIDVDRPKFSAKNRISLQKELRLHRLASRPVFARKHSLYFKPRKVKPSKS